MSRNAFGFHLDGELNGGFNGVQVFVEGLDLVLG